MVLSLTVNRGNSVLTPGIIRYSSIAGILLLGTTQANVEIPVRTAGDFSKLAVYISANSLNGNCVIRLHKNGSAVNGVITITSSDPPGWYEHTGSADTFAATDNISVVFNSTAASSGSITFQLMRIRFDPTNVSECVTLLASRGNVSTVADDQISYATPGGWNDSHHTSESERHLRMRMDCTANRFYVKVSNNARETDTIFSTRVNGAAGGQTVTAVAGVAAFLEDTSGNDPISIGDDYSFQQETQSFIVTANLDITIQLMGVQLKSANEEFLLVASGGVTVNGGTITYLPVGGRLASNGTEANVEVEFTPPVKVKEFATLVTVHTLASAANRDEVYLRKTSTNTAQVAAFGSIAGLKTSGTANPVSSDLGGDTFSYLCDCSESSSGQVSLRWIAAVCTALTNKVHDTGDHSRLDIRAPTAVAC